MEQTTSPELMEKLLKMQRDEITGSILYGKIAARQKDENNKRVFSEISRAERGHYETWRGYTKQEVAPNRRKIALFSNTRTRSDRTPCTRSSCMPVSRPCPTAG